MYDNLQKAIAGQKFGLDAETESLAAGVELKPGDPVFGMVGDSKTGFGASVSAVALTASAALVSGNKVAVTINGIVIPPVEYETSSVATLKKLVNAIDQNVAVRDLGIDAFFEEGTPLAVILQGPGVAITASATVTGGASQPTFASSAYSAMKFMGVARFEELVYGKDVGVFPVGAAVPVQTSGKIYVPVADNASPDDKKPAYVILTGVDAGKFTDVAGGNYDTGCFFRSSRVTENLALIEVRGMK
jgi:hypothetical protein